MTEAEMIASLADGQRRGTHGVDGTPFASLDRAAAYRVQSGVLKAVISMRLVPRADGHGRVPAVEVMIATPFIRDCIINKDKTKLIHEAIAAGVSQYGMQTFDQSIFQLYKKELITYDEALRRASNPDEFKLKIQGIQSTSDIAAEEMEKTMQSFDLE